MLWSKKVTAEKLNFFVKDFLSKCLQIRIFPADSFTLTKEILNGKLYFLDCNQSR